MQPGEHDLVTLPLIADQRLFPLKVRSATPLSDDDLWTLCRANPELRVERTSEGELIIMSPTGGETSRLNAALSFEVFTWARADGTGVVFDSSGGFILPNGAERAPDVSWVRKARYDALSSSQRQRFPPLCPEFVIELRSPSDALEELHAKMREYLENGAELGLLLDPATRQVWVYGRGASPARLDDPTTVSCAPTLPGFELEVGRIW